MVDKKSAIEEKKGRRSFAIKILLFLCDLVVYRDEVLVSGISCTVISIINNKKKKRKRIHKKRVW
jgi:hypothetical protein